MRSLLVAIFLAAASLNASASLYILLDIGTRDGEPVYFLNRAERPWPEQLEVFKAVFAAGPSDPIYLRPAPETEMETIFKVLRALKAVGLRNLKMTAGTEVVDVSDSAGQNREYTVDQWLDVQLEK